MKLDEPKYLYQKSVKTRRRETSPLGILCSSCLSIQNCRKAAIRSRPNRMEETRWVSCAVGPGGLCIKIPWYGFLATRCQIFLFFMASALKRPERAEHFERPCSKVPLLQCKHILKQIPLNRRHITGVNILGKLELEVFFFSLLL